MSQKLEWEDIVALLEPNSSASAKDAYDNEDDLPVGEIYVHEEGDSEVYTIHVGTEEGNAELNEDDCVYGDGETITYHNNDHRDACFCDILPSHLYDLLHD